MRSATFELELGWVGVWMICIWNAGEKPDWQERCSDRYPSGQCVKLYILRRSNRLSRIQLCRDKGDLKDWEHGLTNIPNSDIIVSWLESF